ncbi:hypothetical protein DL240_17245 [Lujinxingia litoralis]|uniref:SRCR domain-containing protein n=1 Tax=Lujinxingia litoralis TaxID=2211119 RepID=A0A328C3L5_9DELT|nr:hypothetical protein [Lujinxingia litoralis]RAL20327.1 hypothetical protein DL240_17245 [Lujinxingia litoralis]
MQQRKMMSLWSVRLWCTASVLIWLVACNLKDDAGQLSNDGDVAFDGDFLDVDSSPQATCDDDVKNAQESGVDCGGSECEACRTGESCREASDCDSGYCTAGVCVEESCADVTCGDDETCYRAVCYLSCDGADACDPSSRCYEGVCLPLDCSATTCESDETCYRGVCYAACSGDASCPEEGAQCLEGSCVVATCTDGLQNGAETDIDCGGSECEACAPGKACQEEGDCRAPVAGEWSVCDFGESTCAQVGTQERTVVSYSCGDSQICEAHEELETRECTRTTEDEVCGETVVGEWGACQGAGEQGVCSTQGQRRRVITSFACAQGSCEVVEDEEFETCVLDTNAQACGTPEAGAWSACGGFESVCDTTGARSRTVTYFECGSGTCAERVDTETEACSRVTQGESCGEVSYGEWSACEGFSGVCGRTGTQSRTVTYRECNGGACTTRTSSETQTCTRNTDGVSCQADAMGEWSACSYATECSTSGSRTRTVTEYDCLGGSCAQSSRTETDTAGCARNTVGVSCGTTSYGGWSTCGGFSNACDTTGEQTRTATDRVCSNGTCSSVNRTEVQSCTRSTNGSSCGTTSYGGWSTCGGFSNACDTTGEQTRTATDRVCSNGTCSSVNRTEVQSCTRSTNGSSCGTTSYGGWSTCGGFSNACDTTGEQTRTATDRVCSNGTCSSVNRTEVQSCTRSTNGAVCGEGDTYGSWSACNYSSTCDTSATRTRTKYTRRCSAGSCSTTTSTVSESCSRNTNGTTCGATTYGNWSSCSIVPICEFSTKSRSVTTRTCSGGSCQTNTSTEWANCYYNAPNPGQECP